MKQSWKKWLRTATFGVMAVAALGVMAGCGNDNAAPADKSVLKFGVTNFADTLETTQNYFGWTVMRYGIGETLVKFDEKMNTQPWLAESWSVSDDKMTWTFKINDKAKFSNGNKVTAEAVKASIERSFEKNKRAFTFFQYTDIKAEGQNLIITTDKAYPNVPGFLADPLFIIVDVSAEKAGRNFAKEGPIGTGPYKVKSFTKEKAVVEANENYWDGEVPFKTVEFPSIDDPTTRALALQNGDVDVAVNIAAGDIETLRNDSKFNVEEMASLRTVLARINQKGVLGDPKVRAAFISGTDRKSYNEVLLKGTFIPGKAPIPPSLDYGFDELKDPNAYNPERSKQLLAEAGWKDTNGDGYVDKDGKNLEVRFVVYNSRQELPIYAEGVQSDMKKIGIKVNIETVDYNLLDKMGIDGDYDLLISNTITANTGDPEIFLKWYWKTNLNGENPQNGSGYSNPKFDAIMDQLAVEFDKSKRRSLIIEAQQILLDDGAALFLGYAKANIVNKNWLTNVVMYPTDYYWLTKNIKPAK